MSIIPDHWRLTLLMVSLIFVTINLVVDILYTVGRSRACVPTLRPPRPDPPRERIVRTPPSRNKANSNASH